MIKRNQYKFLNKILLKIGLKVENFVPILDFSTLTPILTIFLLENLYWFILAIARESNQLSKSYLIKDWPTIYQVITSFARFSQNSIISSLKSGQFQIFLLKFWPGQDALFTSKFSKRSSKKWPLTPPSILIHKSTKHLTTPSNIKQT
jgi:hypothetical protein